MIDLGDNDIVHVNYAQHSRVAIVLGKDVVVYVDYTLVARLWWRGLWQKCSIPV